MEKMSLIIPCYNEEQSVTILYNEIDRVSRELPGYELEMLFVDDGSKDDTLKIVKSFAVRDPRVKYLSFSRNFGKEAAMYAGFCNASGSLVAVMDADMQDPPSLLPKMVKILESGQWDSVATRRVTRRGEPPVRSFFARMFYKATRDIARLSDVLGHSSIETTRIYLISTGAEHARTMNRLGLVS